MRTKNNQRRCVALHEATVALLRQLVGDHNPHGLDPAFASEMSLPGPIRYALYEPAV